MNRDWLLNMTMRYSEGVLGDSFDRNLAQKVVKRFLAYNNVRLERTQLALTERQRVVLAVLPLLYHVNHEKMPGYVGPECPVGVARYNPSTDCIRAAKTVSMSFQYQQRRSGVPRIRSLFLMGSCGSLGHSGGSDLDIWLCHSPDLNDDELALLQEKAKGIEQWADGIGLEVHFFLMDADKFRRGERNDLDGEDCGSAQHQLLLDEFYRTSILIAGCYPIWWLVPPNMEVQYEDYVYRLEKQGFVYAEEVIDFGGLGEFPAGEFIGAGMWQLYKAIGSPYKSILKLLLTEIYASQYPNIISISQDLKTHIYDETTVIDELDPYLLLYDRLEAYLLGREEQDRLELIRRCIYFKSNIPMGQSTRRKHWKRDMLKPLIREWGWADGYLLHVDNRAQWHVYEVMEERKLLVSELIHSYKFLSRFSRRYQEETLLTARDMTVLGNKLYATFDRKPGKVDMINPSISKDIQEDKLTLHLSRQHVRRRIPKMAWSLFTGVARPGADSSAVKKSASLIELLAWCHVNQVMGKGTNIMLYQGRQHLNDYEIREILGTFQQLDLPSAYDTNFEKPPRPHIVHLYVNVFVDPMSHYTRKGMHKISNRTDALGYSALKENLVLTMDQLVYNTWREVLVTRYEGHNTLLRVLEDYLLSFPAGKTKPPPEVVVHCFSPTRPKAIASRVAEVLNGVRACFYRHQGQNARYVLQMGNTYHVIQFVQNRPMIYHFDKPSGLLGHLAKPQPGYSQIVLDSEALKGTAVKLVCENARPGRVQVYYLRKQNQAHMYVTDERGSLIFWRTAMFNEASLVNPLNRFLRQVEYRQNRHRYSHPEQAQERQMEFYEIVLPKKEEGMSLRPVRPNDGIGDRYFDVHAQVDLDAQNKLGFTLFCEEQEFSHLEHGDQIYKALVRYVVRKRKTAQPYPIYISDLSIADRLHKRNAKQVLQTARYLSYKQKLESRLSKALSDLYPAPSK